MDQKPTPGPWRVNDDAAIAVVSPRYGDVLPDGAIYLPVPICRVGEGHNRPVAEALANARLIAAAPAFALAWELVPDEIRERIFDSLHKPDTDWVERAIRESHP